MRRCRRRDRLVVPRAVSIRDCRSCIGLIKASNECRRAADMAAASWAPVGNRSPPQRGGVRGGPAALASPSYGPHGKRGTAWSRPLGARGGGGGNSPPAPPSTPWRGGGGNSLPPTPPAPSGGRDENTPPSTSPRSLGGERREYPSSCAPRAMGGEETGIPFRLHPRRSARHTPAWRCRLDAPAEEGSLRGPGTPSPRWLRHGRPVTGCRRQGRRSPSPQWCPWWEDSVHLRTQSIVKDNLNRTVTPKGKTKHRRKTTVRTDTG